MKIWLRGKIIDRVSLGYASLTNDIEIEIKRDIGEQREKNLKREIHNMRKDLEEAFGIQKITQLENKISEISKERIKIEEEIRVMEQIQSHSQKAMSEEQLK